MKPAELRAKLATERPPVVVVDDDLNDWKPGTSPADAAGRRSALRPAGSQRTDYRGFTIVVSFHTGNWWVESAPNRIMTWVNNLQEGYAWIDSHIVKQAALLDSKRSKRATE